MPSAGYVRLRARPAGGRHAGDAQALSRARRHRRGLAPRPADHHPSARAARRSRTARRFARGIAAGADAVMVAHIELPALDPAEFSPATLSAPIVTGLLRGEMKFGGLVYTDSMSMDAVSRRLSPGEAAVRAIQAGNDIVLHSPDEAAAVAAIKSGGAERARFRWRRSTQSVRRILQAKARLGLYKTRTVALDDVPKRVGGRRAHAWSRSSSARSRSRCSRTIATRCRCACRAKRRCCICRCSTTRQNWRIAAPSRTFLPELRERWPNVAAIELSDRSTTRRDRTRARVSAALRRDRRVGASCGRRPAAAGWIWRRRS